MVDLKSILYVVAVPIGNWDDITLRALKIFKKVDYVVCESFKEGDRLLNYYQIDHEPDFIKLINEHNEKEEVPYLIRDLKEGKNLALISDAGTPLLEDPGNLFVKKCHQLGIKVVPIPGVSSITALLSVSGFRLKKFLYYGLLSANKEQRKKELVKLKKENKAFILLDTPYRFLDLLEELITYLGPKREVVVGYELTKKEQESIQYGSLNEVLSFFKNNGISKGEFILLVKGKR